VTTQGPATQGARVARLARRGVLSVGGVDAAKFLNDLVTADVSRAGPNRAVYAGLLSPQGKILFDFIVFRDGDDFLLDVAGSKAAELARRLGFYRLRANVTIADRSADIAVLVAWGDAPPAMAGIVVPDPRLAALGWRAIVPDGNSTNAGEHDYDAYRIALGVPEGGIDFAFGDLFPHDVDMDQLAGIDFTKGCYVGQEVVSRIEHRHTARRRFVTVAGTGPLPEKGAEITANGKPVGTLGSSSNGFGLALVRLDRAKEALDRGETMVAAGAPLTLAIPPWARFDWPATVSGEP
jgi:folate-binding protein YgfZ